MSIKKVRVIIECPHCSFNKHLDCGYCNNTREENTYVDLDLLMFGIAERLRFYGYIHDHDEGGKGI